MQKYARTFKHSAEEHTMHVQSASAVFSVITKRYIVLLIVVLLAVVDYRLYK